MARLFTGGYTAELQGNASGIGVLHAGAADDPLAGGQLSYADAVTAHGSPSWLAWHPTLPVLYAAMEGSGTVRAFTRTGEQSFAPLGAPVAVGRAVCHLAVAPDGGWLVASCYEDGRVVRIGVRSRGELVGVVTGDSASDPYSKIHAEGGMISRAVAPEPPQERSAMDALVALLTASDEEPPAPAEPEGARRSHPHHAQFTPAGLVTTDLGLDQVRIWHTREGQLRERQRVVLPRGSGPRHSVWHPSGHLYVVTEYSNEVFVLRPAADGTWSLAGGTPLVGTQEGVDFAAEIALTRDAQHVLVGVRGSNTIATLRVNGDGDAPRAVALVESGVEGPRHHVIARDTLLVAGQRSNDVASLTIDERTGVPGRARRRVDVPSPTCLLLDAAS